LTAASYKLDKVGNDIALKKTIGEITGLGASSIAILSVTDANTVSTASLFTSAAVSMQVVYSVSFSVETYGGLEQGRSLFSNKISGSIGSTFTNLLQSNANANSPLKYI